MRYLICNTGWMEFYKGNRKSDQISGGGSFVKDEGMGHEVCNFQNHRAMIYGYVQPAHGQRSASVGSIKLESIVGSNALVNDEKIDGVLVIWTATRPEGGSVVVGWYKDATVFREYQTFQSAPALHLKNGLDGYRIQAEFENVKLLPIDERTIQVPRRTKGGMGQSNVWYGNSDIGVEFVKKVQALIKGKPNKSGIKRTRSTDPEHNAKVEKSAVDLVWQYYENLGYELSSVEKDNVGWDLEASQNKTKLKIEVKGLSGKTPNIELSPNEYTAFSENYSVYRLAIVTNALTAPSLYICRYSQEKKHWQVEVGSEATVCITEKVAAQVKLRI
ncbi:protein NO VEIN domain-containing protein [Marinomonas shanghaiensis]|uniref:protein NO VEIN domain-containing protein n=1 Tax=Marinomonas shanghaiensis TaxID=2202418 RepID=UPI003A935685